MKNRDEFRQDVYRRFDEYKKKKEERRRGALKYGTVAVSALAVAALFIWPGIGIVDSVFGPNTQGIAVDTFMTDDFGTYANIEGDKTGATEVAVGSGTDGAAHTENGFTAASADGSVETGLTAGMTTVADTTAGMTTLAHPDATTATTDKKNTAATESSVQTDEDGVLTYASKYAVAIEGAEFVEKHIIPENLNELNCFVDENIHMCADVSSYQSGDKSNYVYAFVVRGTAKVSFEEIKVGDRAAYRYIIQITDGEEYNMYVCFFDSNFTAEINIVK